MIVTHAGARVKLVAAARGGARFRAGRDCVDGPVRRGLWDGGGRCCLGR